MKKRRYTFGYLFVRFSKLLAIIATLATAVSVVYLFVDHCLKADNLAYRKTNALDLKCRQLEDELEFAKREVSRIGSVGDLSVIKFPTNSSNSSGFNSLLSDLQSAGQRQSVLKERLTDGFASRTELLRAKIRVVIESIEASRAAASPDPQIQIRPKSSPVIRATPTPSAFDRQRTVFDSIESGELDSIQQNLKQIGNFLDQLETSAEKEDNKKLIQDAKASLNDLEIWLPRKRLERSAGFPIEQAQIDISSVAEKMQNDGPPPDPLTTALNNYELLGKSIQIVKSEVSRGWCIDRILLETVQMAECEAQKCREAEDSIKMLRLSTFGKICTFLLIGLVAAFLVLVFADFLQSFFDTASNSAAIFEILGRE